jgi:DNA repair protein RecO (recombination protein O)
MTERASGIILRTRPLTDTSLIVQWLTPEFGRVATVAKGARRAKSPFLGKLDWLFEADFSFARSRRSELHTLREVNVRDPHPTIRNELGWLNQAAYAVNFLEHLTETETPLPDVCELFIGFVRHLARQPAQPRTVFAFELKLLASQGLEPDLSDTSLSEGTKALMQQLQATGWAELPSLKASAKQARELRQFLHGFIIYHCHKLPKGRAEALAVS